MKSMLFNLENELNNYNSQMTQLDIQILQLKDSLSQVNGGIFALKEITKKIKQTNIPILQSGPQPVLQQMQQMPVLQQMPGPQPVPVPENVQVPGTIVEEH